MPGVRPAPLLVLVCDAPRVGEERGKDEVKVGVTVDDAGIRKDGVEVACVAVALPKDEKTSNVSEIANISGQIF